jgi:hypothetical protein
MKKISLLFLFLFIYVSGSFAQLSNYSFYYSTSTYTDIIPSFPNLAIASSWDDNTSAVLPIGFTFNFNGTNYTTFYVNANGFITFGGGVSSYTPISSSGYNTIAGIGRDLMSGSYNAYGNGIANNPVYYITTGTTNNHVLTIQWTDCSEYTCCSAGYAADLNFQIKLYENHNKVEVVYGNCSVPAVEGNLNPQVGLGYSPSAQFNNRTTASGWGSSLPGGNNSATATLTNAIVPASGTTYDWLVCDATVAPTNNGPICLGQPLQLTGTNTNGVTYSWTGPGGFTSTQQSPSTTPTVSGTLVYTFTATSSYCYTTGTTTATVVPLPTGYVFTPATPTICNGSSTTVNVSANAAPPPSYAWTPVGGLSCTGCASPVANPTSTTTYTVTATSQGCSSSSTVTVTVNPIPASATITPSGAVSFCQGSSQLLSANVVAGMTYQWFIYGNPITGATNNTYTATTSGNYTVQLTNSNNCSLMSAITTVTATPAPTATASTNGPTTVCQGSTVNIYGTAGAGLSYQWQQNGGAIGGATNASYAASTSGTYNVIVSQNGCPATSNDVVIAVAALPSATVTASGPLSFCAGGSVTLTVPSGGGNVYQWTQNNTVVNGATQNTYSPTTAGTYNVTVTNASGCSATSANTVVNPHPAPTASFYPVGPTTFCQGGSVLLQGTTGSGYSYQWTLNGGNIANATNPTYTATASGTYNLITTYDCSVTATPLVITVNALPPVTVTAGGPLGFCAGNSVTLMGNTGTGLTYQWQQNGININNATNANYVATAAGTYNLVVTNIYTCSSTSGNNVVNVSLPVAATVTYNGPTSMCSGSNLLLTANTGAGLTYKWLQNGGAIAGATNPTYSASTSGTYSVIVNNGCPDTSSSVQINVHAAPTAAITSTGAPAVCEGQSVLLHANQNPAYTYQWQMNSNNLPGATDSTYVATVGGPYTLIVTYDCQASSNPFTVTINPYPQTTITGPASVCQGSSITLNANTGTGLNYQWFQDGNAISGATTPTLNVTTGGVYSVKETDANNCSYADSDNVLLYPLPTPVIVKSPTHLLSTTVAYTTYQWYLNGQPLQNGNLPTLQAMQDGVYYVRVTDANWCFDSSQNDTIQVTGVNNVVTSANGLSLYPNPNDGEFTLAGNISSADGMVELSIVNVEGRVVFTDKFAVNNSQLNRKISLTDAATPGMYMIRIKTTEGNTTLPFVKQ